MKKKAIVLFLICAFTMAHTPVMSQVIKITYKEHLTPKIPKVDDPQIAALVKEQLKKSSKTTVLLCNSDEKKSLYKRMNNAQSPTRSMGVESNVFKNMSTNKYISNADILDKQFLISEDLQKPEWKMLEETKEIKGFSCKKAILPDNTIAWYAPAIAVSDGPASYWGLQGMILEVQTGNRHIVCENIELNSKDETSIVPPKKGKKVSRKKFKKILEKKKEQYGGVGSQSGAVKIIRM